MASVTGRIRKIEQPYGGYLKSSEFDTCVINDGIILNEKENVHGSIIGMAVDYLTRYCIKGDAMSAFMISLFGANNAENYGIKGANEIANSLLAGIKGIDDNSIINACKLVTFDVWYRNPGAAFGVKNTYKETNPDIATIQNIRTFVKRSIEFFEKYGPPVVSGFNFNPEDENEEYLTMINTGKGSYGGYTATVSEGDGDFLTEDTLWDFKVTKSKPDKKNTLQLLMYQIMGKHSGQDIFEDITKLGIFNPRLNTVYLLDVSKISTEVIKTIENEVICY